MRSAWTLRAVLALVLVAHAAFAKGLSDDEVAQILIRESIAAYSGSCPCPYNVDRAGRSCGRRSAYSKPGGESPLCYRRDVTDTMIRAWRK